MATSPVPPGSTAELVAHLPLLVYVAVHRGVYSSAPLTRCTLSMACHLAIAAGTSVPVRKVALAVVESALRSVVPAVLW